MSTPAISHAELCQLVQDLSRTRTGGCKFNPGATHPDLPAGETGILEFTTPNSVRFVFSEGGFTFPGHGFVPYQDAAWVDWGNHDVERKDDHKEYLLIAFRDRPPITVNVSDARTTVALFGLIKLMQTLTNTLPKI
jgi:hypothetical protein